MLGVGVSKRRFKKVWKLSLLIEKEFQTKLYSFYVISADPCLR